MGTVKISFKKLQMETLSLENENFIYSWSMGNTVEDLNIFESPNFKFLETVNLKHVIYGQVLCKTNANFQYPFALWKFIKGVKLLTVTLCTNFGDKLPCKAHKLS